MDTRFFNAGEVKDVKAGPEAARLDASLITIAESPEFKRSKRFQVGHALSLCALAVERGEWDNVTPITVWNPYDIGTAYRHRDYMNYGFTWEDVQTPGVLLYRTCVTGWRSHGLPTASADDLFSGVGVSVVIRRERNHHPFSGGWEAYTTPSACDLLRQQLRERARQSDFTLSASTSFVYAPASLAAVLMDAVRYRMTCSAD